MPASNARVPFAPLPKGMMQVGGAGTAPRFDMLLLLIEHDASFGLRIPSVRERVERFVGA